MIEYRGEKTAAGADILQNVHAVVDEMLEDGMKVIAVAYKTFMPRILGTTINETYMGHDWVFSCLP